MTSDNGPHDPAPAPAGWLKPLLTRLLARWQRTRTPVAAAPQTLQPRRSGHCSGRSVQCVSPSGLHRMAYREWGAADNPQVLVCVHGLTRNSHDFDRLAEALAEDYRVICPDVVGRGESDWLADPAGYAIPQYVGDMITLLARLNVPQVDWFGTSMGGLIGMSLASLKQSPVRRLVLNDVGPLIQGDALRRISQYVGVMPKWPDRAAATAALKALCAPFGLKTEAEWTHLVTHSTRQAEDGSYGLTYDPAIANPFRHAFAAQDISLWGLYDAMTCPTLAIRGADSDLLRRQTWQEMATRGPQASLLEIPDTGHAPMFLRVEEIALVRAFLNGMPVTG